MQKDERLLPLPNAANLQLPNTDIPANYSPLYDEEALAEGRSVREYFNVVYKRLPLILAMAILTTTVVAFYMYRQPTIYQASTEMIIEPRKPRVQSKELNINFGADARYYDTQMKLLQNPDLMYKVVVRLNLHQDPNLFSGQNKSVFGTFSSMFSKDKNTAGSDSTSLPTLTSETGIDLNRPEQSALTEEEKERAETYATILLGNLSIEKVDKTNLVNIIVKSTNQRVAPKVADTVAEVFIEQDIERETQGSKQTYDDISKSIEDLKVTIASQSQQSIAERSSNNIPLTGGKGEDFNASRLQTISGQLLGARDDRRKLEAEYSAAANAGDQIFGVLGNNEAVSSMRSRLAERKAKLENDIQSLNNEIQTLNAKKSNLLARYKEEYSEVRQVNEEIKKRQETLNEKKKESTVNIEQEEAKVTKDVTKEVLTGKRAQLQAAQQREAKLQSDYEAEISSANRQGVAETRLMTLTRELENNRQLLDTYTTKQKELELLVSSSKPDNLKISSTAPKLGLPIGPNRGRNISVALLISLAAGIGLAFLLDYLDDSVKSSDDVGRYLGLPTLALIPYQSFSDKRKLMPGHSKNGNRAASSTALVALEDNRSATAEAYRHLRTSLLFSSAGKPPQTILVTSSQPSEGKTTTAINTAITLAQSGADVVIVDCDLRRPRLHQHFGLENISGLTNYLSGEKNPDNLLKPFPGLPKLKVITSGPIPPNPAELLSSNEMKNLLQFLKGNFKHIVIDSPPAISFTDAAILSTLVDGVILVALAGKSSIHLMRRFKQRLGIIGARIYGVVLNGVKANSVEYGYYGYSYTNYYAHDESTPMMEDLMEEENAYATHNTKS
ncbi:MAG: polysaccharide biosynthesis tyrosine autokinase [Pyrinomonadaceae bacterium]